MKFRISKRAGFVIAPIWVAIVAGVWLAQLVFGLAWYNHEADPAFRKTETPAIPSNK